MADYRTIPNKVGHMLYSAHADSPDISREDLRYLLSEIQRISAHACILIDQEIIRELKDARRAMSEHGFTGDPAPRSPRPPATHATLDDIL